MVISILRIESFHSERTDDTALINLERTESVYRIKELRRDGHSDGEIRSELVIRSISSGGSTVDILVDSSTVYERRNDRMSRVLGRICGKWISFDQVREMIRRTSWNVVESLE